MHYKAILVRNDSEAFLLEKSAYEYVSLFLRNHHSMPADYQIYYVIEEPVGEYIYAGFPKRSFITF